MQRNRVFCVFHYVMLRRPGCLALLPVAWAGVVACQQTTPATRSPAATPAVTTQSVPLKNAASIAMEPMQPWTDTGIVLRRGDSLQFTATGRISFPGGRTASADGMLRGWRDMLRMFPVDTAPAGALVGRIGENESAVPFLIGQSSTRVAGSAGKLYVRCNTSAESPATGSLQLSLQVKRATPTTPSFPPVAGATTLPIGRLEGLPRRVADAASHPGDVLNFAMIGTEDQVRSALESAGWVSVDADVQSAVLHGLLSTLQHKPYLEVPMSPLYLFGRVQDLSYARASAITVASERHHLRCWKTGTLLGGVPLWIGSATHDIGFERDQRNGSVTHSIAPEIDQERDFLRDTLVGAGAVANPTYFPPKHPVREGQTATGGAFTTDGRVLVLQLR